MATANPIQLDGGIERRFWLNVVVGDGCFEWQGNLDKKGYGRCHAGNRAVFAHRLAWTIFNGQVPDGLELDHLCRNRRCVRIDHLEAVTHAENIRRSNCIGTLNAAKTECPQGHAYDDENTYVTPRGARICKVCKAEHQRSWRFRVNERKGSS